MKYLKIFKSLFDEKIRYMICGGLAMNIYGIPRMTIDIDLLLDFTEDNIKSFQKVLKQLKYKPLAPVELRTLVSEQKRNEIIEEKNMIAYSYYNQISNYVQLDILLKTPLSFEVMWKKKSERKSNGYSLFLVSVEHLIEMKQYSDRIQDRDDILLLTKFIKR